MTNTNRSNVAPARAWVRPAVTRLKAGEAESGFNARISDGGFSQS